MINLIVYENTDQKAIVQTRMATLIILLTIDIQRASHSEYRLLTGFASATFRHCNEMSRKAIAVTKMPAIE
jgi:hypothetical protein